MEAKETETITIKQNIYKQDSFELSINNNKINFNFNSKNKLLEEEKSENIFINKYLEEANLNEIYDLFYKINNTISTSVFITENKNKNSCNKKRSCSCESKHFTHDKHHSKELREILYILKKPLNEIPFKPLLKPKQISLVGKVFFAIPSDNNNQISDDNFNSNIVYILKVIKLSWKFNAQIIYYMEVLYMLLFYDYIDFIDLIYIIFTNRLNIQI